MVATQLSVSMTELQCGLSAVRAWAVESQQGKCF